MKQFEPRESLACASRDARLFREFAVLPRLNCINGLGSNVSRCRRETATFSANSTPTPTRATRSLVVDIRALKLPVRAQPPGAVRAALLEIFGQDVDRVVVVEHSWYARLHVGMTATTRRRRIYLRGSA